MCTYLYLDLETRSSMPISRGIKNYVSSPDFKILLIAYAIDDNPVSCCIPEEMPSALRKALDSDCKVVIHNSVFDATCLKYAKIANIKVSRIIDTMIQAYSHALPPSLDALSKLFQLGDLAKKDGTALIKHFCVPDKHGQFNPYGDDQVQMSFLPNINIKWQKFKEYAKADVSAMRRLFKIMPRYNYPNLQFKREYFENLLVNCNGIPLDMEFIKSAVTLYKKEFCRLNNEFYKNHGFNLTQNDKFIKYLQNKGVDIPNCQAETLEGLINSGEFSPNILKDIQLKLDIMQSTPKKYVTLLDNQYNGRIYHTLQFMGASRTGRDAGRVFQPQNLKRPSLFKHCNTDAEENELIEDYIDKVKKGSLPDSVNKINLLSELIRNVIKPSDFNKIVVSDLSNIEGRTLVWLAGEEWKLQFFKDFDCGKIKFDNYVMAYSRAMNVLPNEVTKDQRAIGKVMELALGYGGGVGSFLNFATVYGLNIHELYKNVYASFNDGTDELLFQESDFGFNESYGLSLDEYRTCNYLKHKWRKSHNKIVKFWSDLEKYFKLAVTENNKNIYTLGKLKFFYENDYLIIKLPSGRHLLYYKPHISPSLSFIAPSKTAVKYERVETYGGRLCENVASAVARDILYANLNIIRQYGYKIITLVHDEVITEAPRELKFNGDHLSFLLKTPPEWAKDLPLSASGFENIRYKGK